MRISTILNIEYFSIVLSRKKKHIKRKKKGIFCKKRKTILSMKSYIPLKGSLGSLNSLRSLNLLCSCDPLGSLASTTFENIVLYVLIGFIGLIKLI